MNATGSTCDSSQSVVILIDAQERLAGAMPGADLQRFTECTSILLQGAVQLDIPVLVTEQYPQGLGKTIHHRMFRCMLPAAAG